MNSAAVARGAALAASLVLATAPAALAQGTWATPTTAGAPAARQSHTAVWTGTKMIVWGGEGSGGTALNTGAAYDPAVDVWSALPLAGAPAARRAHTAVWTGSRMIVWGGQEASGTRLRTGGLYDPLTNGWTAVTTTGAPSARSGHTAVWTGTRMLVWGGHSGSASLADGASYDPATNTWTPLGSAEAPTARSGHTAVWTGSRMIVWGGVGPSGFSEATLSSGAAYDPAGNAWSAINGTGAPAARQRHTAEWTGARMVVWGGVSGIASNSAALGTGGRYDPSANAWTDVATSGAPLARGGHRSVWTGTRMLVWGGINQGTALDTGGAYDPVANGWTATATANAPSGRSGHTAIWTGTRMLVWGGLGQTAPLDSGGLYDPTGAINRLILVKSGTGTGTVQSSPAGIGCGPACLSAFHDFTAGATVTLTATAANGSTFAGWSGACSGTAPCPLTMDLQKAVTASFNLLRPDLVAAVLLVAPGLAPPGSIVSAQYSVANQGDLLAGASAAKLWLSADGVLDPGVDADLGTVSIGSLSPGASAQGSVGLALPSGLAWGSWHVIAQADALGVVTEGNESNNTGSRPFRVGTRPSDLDLDQRDDVLVRKPAGEVMGLTSTGTGFAVSAWSEGFVSYRYDVYLGDVTGDGRADLVARSKDNGNVEVFRSTGTSFAYAPGSGPGGVWSYGWGTSYDLYFADATGDGKADLVGRLRSNGDVHVFASTGSSFAYAPGSGPGGLWSYGWSSGYDLYFTDVTGDHKADIVSRYYGPTAGLTGDVYVGASTGGGFSSPTRWTYGYSAGYDLYFADVDGDSRSDLVARYFGPTAGLTGDVYVMPSTGSGFSWAFGSGRMSYGWGSSYALLFRDVTGDGRADLVSRRADTGEMEVALWAGAGFSYDGVWTTGILEGWDLR